MAARFFATLLAVGVFLQFAVTPPSGPPRFLTASIETEAPTQANETAQTEDEPTSTEAGGLPDFTWAGVAWLVLIFGCCGGCIGAYLCCGPFSDSGKTRTAAGLLDECSSEYTSLDKKEWARGVTSREAYLMPVLVFLPLLGLGETTCEDGAPLWLYCGYLALLVRVKCVELRIFWKLSEAPLAAWTAATLCSDLALGAAEHADAFTDGAFLAQAWACDEMVTPRLAGSFVAAGMPSLGYAIGQLGFVGIGAFLLGFAMAAQQYAIYLDLNCGKWMALEELAAIGGDGAAIAADAAGMGSVARLLEAKEEETGMSRTALVSLFTKVLSENCLQLLMQSSFYMAAYSYTKETARWKMLISMALGGASATLKCVGALFNLWSHGGAFWAVGLFSWQLTIDAAIAAVLGLALVGWAAAKLYMADVCESHYWNLSSGCVSVDAIVQ